MSQVLVCMDIILDKIFVLKIQPTNFNNIGLIILYTDEYGKDLQKNMFL